MHLSLSTSSPLSRLLYKAILAIPVSFRWLLEANACQVCHLRTAITTQQAACFIALIASILMFVLLTLFLWLLHIFLIIAVSVFDLLRRLLTIGVSSSGSTNFLLLLLNLRRATSLLLNNLFMWRFLSWCRLWIILIILAFEVLLVIGLSSTRVSRQGCLCLLGSCLLLFLLSGLSDGLSVELLLLFDLVVNLSLKELCIYPLKNSDWHSQRQDIVIHSFLEHILAPRRPEWLTRPILEQLKFDDSHILILHFLVRIIAALILLWRLFILALLTLLLILTHFLLYILLRLLLVVLVVLVSQVVRVREALVKSQQKLGELTDAGGFSDLR